MILIVRIIFKVLVPAGFVLNLAFFSFPIALAQDCSASSNISASANEHYAWSDVIGWIDFCNGSVQVTDTNIKGYASSQVDFLALDCNTTPNGSDCGSGANNWGVTNLGVTGNFANLAGWAWSDRIGWISFCGNSTSRGSGWSGTGWTCTFPTYQVQIIVAPGATQGNFVGWAWNDIIGWISFNCDHTGDLYGTSPCGPVDIKLRQAGSPAVAEAGQPAAI